MVIVEKNLIKRSLLSINYFRDAQFVSIENKGLALSIC
jgi:hypothetical protein